MLYTMVKSEFDGSQYSLLGVLPPAWRPDAGRTFKRSPRIVENKKCGLSKSDIVGYGAVRRADSENPTFVE